MDTQSDRASCVIQQKDDFDRLALPSVCPSCKRDKVSCVCTERSDPSDPEKIWAILYYPDAVKISHKKLCTLLKKLKTFKDNQVRFLSLMHLSMCCPTRIPPPPRDIRGNLTLNLT